MNEADTQGIILEKLRQAGDQILPGRLYFCRSGPEVPAGGGIVPTARLDLILSGRKRVTLPLTTGVEKLELEPGDAYFAPPGVWELHGWDTRSEMLCIVPRREYLRVSWYGQTDPDQRPDAIYHHTGRLCSEAVNQVVQLLQNPEVVADPGGAALHLARAAVRLALQDCSRESVPLNGRAARHFAQISTWLENHFQENIGREETASHFAMTPAYLSRIFRQLTGKGFHAYLTRLRLDFARFLLLHTEHPVYLVSSQCGFQNGVHFVRRFREIEGVAPGQFRQRAKEQRAIPEGSTPAVS